MSNVLSLPLLYITSNPNWKDMVTPSFIKHRQLEQSYLTFRLESLNPYMLVTNIIVLLHVPPHALGFSFHFNTLSLHTNLLHL